ncbi:hypothetical protein LCGC14_1203910, partial [marine sediment metagenome]
KASEVTLFAAITETGQFQLYVTVYRAGLRLVKEE